MQPSPDPVELTYRPIVRLDQGGMAEVLLADALGPGGFRRRVVLKRLLPSLRRDPAQIDAFLREARLLSTIRHRNVVGVHRLDRIDGALVLVMDYVEGTTAEGLRRDGEQAPLDPFVAAYVVAEAAAGLQAAHEREDGGIVHRDVAPRNILVGVDGRVVLADFGIARAAGTAHRTADGVVKGTLAYVAPERLHGAPYDHRADVFALGVVLWELLTGQRLYDRPTPLAVAAAIGDADAPPPGSFRRGLPAAFDGIVEGALARDPAQRTPDAGALRSSLLTALGSDPEPYRAADRLAARARRVADAPGADGAHADAAATLSTPSAGRAVARTEHHPDRATRWPRARTAAATGLAAAFVAVGAYALLGGAGGPAGSTAPPPSADVEAALEPEPPMDDRRPVPRPPPAPSRPTARVGQGPADVALPQVRLRVESRPTGATASAAGARCRTPCELRVPRSTEPVALRVERPGRVPVERSVVPDVDREVAVRLARRRPPRVEEERDPSPDFYPFE